MRVQLYAVHDDILESELTIEDMCQVVWQVIIELVYCVVQIPPADGAPPNPRLPLHEVFHCWKLSIVSSNWAKLKHAACVAYERWCYLDSAARCAASGEVMPPKWRIPRWPMSS